MSTSHPRPARPWAASRDTDSEPPTTSRPYLGGTNATRPRSPTVGVPLDEPGDGVQHHLAGVLEREVLDPLVAGADEGVTQWTVGHDAADGGRHQHRILVVEDDAGVGHGPRYGAGGVGD